MACITYPHKTPSYAVQCNATNAYMNCGDITELNNASLFTIECKFYRVITSYLFDKGANDSFALYAQASRVDFYFSGGSCDARSDTEISYTHTVFVYDGTKPTNATKILLYRNGVSTAFSSFVGTIPSVMANNSGNALLINGRGALGNSGGNCQLFRIWKKILTANQIKRLYNRGMHIYTPLTGKRGWDDGLLVAEYLMINGSGTTVTDSTGNYNASLVGSNSWTRT